MKRRLLAFWTQRKPRERLVMQLGALLVLGVLGDRAVLAPQRAQTARVRTELVAARAALDHVRSAIEQQGSQGLSSGQARLDALARRRQAAEAVITQAQSDLISPKEMRRELAAILERFPQLRVVAMKTLAPQPIRAAAPARDGLALAAPAAPGSGAGLYQHGLEVTVDGRYLDLIAYLEVLDHAPYHIYWRDLELNVDAQRGMPRTRIRLFTLSRDATWMSL